MSPHSESGFVLPPDFTHRDAQWDPQRRAFFLEETSPEYGCKREVCVKLNPSADTAFFNLQMTAADNTVTDMSVARPYDPKADDPFLSGERGRMLSLDAEREIHEGSLKGMSFGGKWGADGYLLSMGISHTADSIKSILAFAFNPKNNNALEVMWSQVQQGPLTPGRSVSIPDQFRGPTFRFSYDLDDPYAAQVHLQGIGFLPGLRLNISYRRFAGASEGNAVCGLSPEPRIWSKIANRKLMSVRGQETFS